jgi:hypothetical protein
MAKLSKPTSSGRKFKYTPPNPDAVKRRAENRGGMFDTIFKPGFDTFRPASGDNIVRYLPPTFDDPEDYAYEVWIHTRIGPDKGTYLCPRKMENEACPICDMARECNDAGEEEDFKKLKVKQAFVSWIIDRKGDEDTPKLYQMSWTQDRDLSLVRKQRTGGVLDIANPDVGFDVSFNKSGSGLQTEYSGWAVDRAESPISGDATIQDKVLAYIEDNPIPNTLLMQDFDYLERVVQAKTTERNEDDEEVNDEEDEKKPSRSKTGSIPRERLKPREEPKEEEDNNEDDGEEGVEDDSPLPDEETETDSEEAEAEEENNRRQSSSRRQREDRDRDRGRSEERERYSRPPKNQRR